MMRNLLIYRYKAITHDQKTIRGYVFASSENKAVEMILENHRIASIQKLALRSFQYIKWLYFLSKLFFLALPKSKIKLFCVSEFVEILSHGGDISLALRDVQSQLRMVYYRYLFTVASAKLEMGISVSQTLAGIDLFPPSELRLIQAGEECGALRDVFSVFRDTLSYKIKASSVLVWVIPIIMLAGFVMSISYYTANNIFIYYRAAMILMTGEVPAPFAFFMSIYQGSSIDVAYKFLWGLASIIGLTFALRFFQNRKINIFLDFFRLRIPVLKELYRMQQMLYFTIAFVVASKTGLALHKVFAYSLNNVTCDKYVQQLKIAQYLLENGAQLEQVLLECEIFSYSERLMFQISFTHAENMLESLDYLIEKRRRVVKLVNITILGVALIFLALVCVLLIAATISATFFVG